MSPDAAFLYGQMAARCRGGWHPPRFVDTFLRWAWELGYRLEIHMMEYPEHGG